MSERMEIDGKEWKRVILVEGYIELWHRERFDAYGLGTTW